MTEADERQTTLKTAAEFAAETLVPGGANIVKGDLKNARDLRGSRTGRPLCSRAPAIAPCPRLTRLPKRQPDAGSPSIWACGSARPARDAGGAGKGSGSKLTLYSSFLA